MQILGFYVLPKGAAVRGRAACAGGRLPPAAARLQGRRPTQVLPICFIWWFSQGYYIFLQVKRAFHCQEDSGRICKLFMQEAVWSCRFCFEAGLLEHLCGRLCSAHHHLPSGLFRDLLTCWRRFEGGACGREILDELAARCSRPLDTSNGILPTRHPVRFSSHNSAAVFRKALLSTCT